jgi:geranylgeranylglycerol-phosphate geranylgeranyltransferase
MINVSTLISLSRPANVGMSAAAVVLGYWISASTLPWQMLLLLIIAAAVSVAFGNTVNDLMDINTDRISHPERPLPSGSITAHQTIVFAIMCAVAALSTASIVSSLHCIGVVIPLAALMAYALFFKGTPLVGNILVSLLVAYPLLFGALTGLQINRLYIPAILAFLLNVIREMLKDIQDNDGDAAAGLRTTAILSQSTIKKIISACSLLYILFVPIPLFIHHFGALYALICLIAVLPLHCYWSFLILKRPLKTIAGHCASLIKIEMLAGLAAIAADNVVHHH